MIEQDIAYVKTALPEHYKVKESERKGSIHCVSRTGIRQGMDEEDDEHWGYIFAGLKKHFGGRFMAIDHNTCFCHVNFTIHLKAA